MESIMSRPGTLVGITATIAFLSASCGPASRDVTDNLLFARGYRAGNVYVLQTDLVLIRQDRDYYRTGTPFCFYASQALPHDVRILEQDNPGMKAVGIVAKGTEIRIVKLIAARTNPVPFYWQDLIGPIGKILGGDAVGNDVDLASVSANETDQAIRAHIAIPSQKYLQLKKANTAGSTSMSINGQP